MKSRLITVFGASGFIGGHVVKRLARQGHLVRAAVRNPSSALFLKTMGEVGQITPVQANIRNQDMVANAVDGADGVINLVGIFKQVGRQRFNDVHCEGAKNVALASANLGVERLVHISALGASSCSTSSYAKSKAAGEKVVKEFFSKATIIRPSIVFGPRDVFFNQFAALARISPVLPVFGCPHPKYFNGRLDLFGHGGTQVQPVYAGDVADVIVKIIDADTFAGKTFELGGPEVFSFKQIIEKILYNTKRKRFLLPMPIWFALMGAFLLDFLPTPSSTREHIKMLKNNNVLKDGDDGFAPFDIKPTTVDVVLPRYLDQYCKGGRFSRYSGA